MRARASGIPKEAPRRKKRALKTLWPKTKTSNTKETKQEGVWVPPPEKGNQPFTLTRARGAGETTRGPAFLWPGARPTGNVWSRKHHRRGKQRPQKTIEQTPLPPRVQEKGLREVPRLPRESKKRAGPRMAPRRNARVEGTHGQNKRLDKCGGDRPKESFEAKNSLEG